VPEQIYTLTAGQAFYTQVYCQVLVDHLNERREYGVTAQDLQQVTDEIVENPLPQMIFSWNSMLQMEKIALSIIGEISRQEIKPVSAKDIIAFAKSEKIGYDVDLNKLQEVLEKLFHHDLLDKDSDEAAYTFKMDLWRQWIGRMHSSGRSWTVAPTRGLGEGLTKSPPRLARLSVIVPASVVRPRRGVCADLRNIDKNERAAFAVQMDSTHVTIRTEPPGAWVFLNERRRSHARGKRGGRSGADLPPARARWIQGANRHAGPQEGRALMCRSSWCRGSATLSWAVAERRRHLSDGQKTGLQTPDTLKGLPAGAFRRVGLRLPQYAGHEWPGVRVQEDTTLSLAHAFSKLSCQVTFETEPSGAQIVVDGTVEGKTPAVVFLSYGQHDLALKLPGYHPIENTVTLSSANHTVHETLTKLPQGR
jgi:hypothetical protein